MASVIFRLPAMNSELRGNRVEDAKYKDAFAPFPRAEPYATRLPSRSAWPCSPTLVTKRSVPVAFDEERDPYGVPSHKLSSHSPLKRHRGDSDMSIASAAGISPHQYGSVRITSASIHSVIDSTTDNDIGGYQRSYTSDDGDLDGRVSLSWRSSHGSGRDSVTSSLTEEDQSAYLDESVTDGTRPFITNASRNITFDMLQEHFTKPLKDAASYFGVCTTLLKKVCRKNGILSWPYRQIIGLQKSIASMKQQVQYFDGDQQRQYTEQLAKLHIKLNTFIRTGEAPSEETVMALLQGASPSQLVGADSKRHLDHSSTPRGSPTHVLHTSIMASAVTINDYDHSRPINHQPQRSPSTHNQAAYFGSPQVGTLPPISFMLNQQAQASRLQQDAHQGMYSHEDQPLRNQWQRHNIP